MSVRVTFLRNYLRGSRFVVLVIVASILMFNDYKLQSLQGPKALIKSILYPVQYALSYFSESGINITAYFASKEQLIKNNAALFAERELLLAKTLQFQALEQENAQLYKLLKAIPSGKRELALAKALQINFSPLGHDVLINKGEVDKVFIGQVVLDSNGVVGVVSEVLPYQSEVLLVTDPNCAVPVKFLHNNIKAISVGSGSSKYLTLRHFLPNNDIKIGDMVITSGIDDSFPDGYPVGVVSSIEHQPGAVFATVKLTPTALLDRVDRLLLLSGKS